MIITWDPAKNRKNKKAHGLSFEAAQYVFDDPLQFTRQDRIIDNEMRWQTIGEVNGLLLLLVAHTVTEGNDDETQIKIISARRATKQERKSYEQNS